MKSMQREILNYISQSNFLVEEARQAGVSVGFLSNYIEANIIDIIGREIPEAANCGELGCDRCGNYYNFTDCQYDTEEHPICPDCGTKLWPSSCCQCSKSLITDKGSLIYQGKKSPVSREIVCPECYATLTALKEGQS